MNTRYFLCFFVTTLNTLRKRLYSPNKEVARIILCSIHKIYEDICTRFKPINIHFELDRTQFELDSLLTS
jgi:hypothetical protein